MIAYTAGIESHDIRNPEPKFNIQIIVQPLRSFKLATWWKVRVQRLWEPLVSTASSYSLLCQEDRKSLLAAVAVEAHRLGER